MNAMKILTWNLAYWQFSSHHPGAWDFLCNEIKPDFALLQEVKPPPWVDRDALIFEEITRGWGTAIYCPHLVLSKETIPLFPGRIAAGSLNWGADMTLFVASIHAPIIKGRVFPHLVNIFSELEMRLDSQTMIVGGDLNSARLAEKVWPGNGHGPFFERIDKGDRWIDCCRQFNAEEIQTFFRKGSLNPFQDDHVFVSPDLAPHLRSCAVINNDVTRKLSDHVPVVAELDITL